MKKIYLAGPDVFFRDATARYDALRALCASYGLQGIAPVDGDPLPPNLDGPALAELIYLANMRHIQSCDAVLANVMAFRGPVEPDSGTCFEIGAAVALGKPVALYEASLAQRWEDRVASACGQSKDDSGMAWDATHGFLIESFSQPLNLMLARSCSLHISKEEAVRHLAQTLQGR